MVHWTQVKAVPALLRKLKKEGWRIVAVEQCGRSVSFKKYKPRAKTLYIFGNEISGVPEKVLKLCDDVIDIPMSGKKESLNVSVAAGVILFNVSTEPKNESKAY